MIQVKIFIASVLLSLCTLAVERLIGIGWDFHPDSVTYATVSKDVARIIYSEPEGLFNNAYYVIAALLDENVEVLTAMNILVFGLTNCLLFSAHRRLAGGALLWFVLLALNPYRLHLSTTILKDTLIIFFVAASLTGLGRYFAMLPMLFSLRVASLLYGLSFVTARHLFYLAPVGVVMMLAFGADISAFLERSNEAEMVLRDFDRIPTFQDSGFLGILARGLIWPVLAWSGLFAFLSPAFEYIVVALGSLMNLIYCWRVMGRPVFPAGIFLAMCIFGMLVTGFTAYIRYVYPLLTILPLVALWHHRKSPAKGGNVRGRVPERIPPRPQTVRR